MDCAAANLGEEFAALKSHMKRLKNLPSHHNVEDIQATPKVVAALEELFEEVQWISTISLSQGNQCICCSRIHDP